MDEPFVVFDLGSAKPLSEIVVSNRLDHSWNGFYGLHDVYVLLFDNEPQSDNLEGMFSESKRSFLIQYPGDTENIQFNKTSARYVAFVGKRQYLTKDLVETPQQRVLQMAEVEIY